MIFIYELQKPIPPGCSEDYKICYPLLEGRDQYKFLYKLEFDLLKEIDQIYFIYEKGLELNLYKNTLSEYYSEIERYTDPKLINKIFELNILPEDAENKDKTKKEYVEGLIRNQSYLEFSEHKRFIKEKLPGIKIIIYLPYKGKLTEAFLTEIPSRERLLLFTDSKRMKLKGTPKIMEVESELYLNIKKTLKTIESEKNEDWSKDCYRFRPNSFFEVFDNRLLNEFSIISSDDKRRLQILGEEEFLAARVIDQILLPDTAFYYDLVRGIPHLTNSNTPLVFSHFDVINNIEDYKKLYDRTKEIDGRTHIFLRSAGKKYVPYFNNYYDMELPDKEGIKKVITSLFIVSLIEKNLLNTPYYKLISLIKNNSFLIFLKELRELKSLYHTSDEIEKITADDLIQNSDMWYFIVSEIKRLGEGNKGKEKSEQKTKITFEYDKNNNNWEISVYGKPMNYKYSESMGIKYIAILIYYQQTNKKPIDVSVLKTAAYNLDNPNSLTDSKHRDKEKDRKAILDGLIRIKRSPYMKTFCENYIKYSKYEYWFDPKDEIECKVLHPQLNEDFIKTIKRLLNK